MFRRAATLLTRPTTAVAAASRARLFCTAEAPPAKKHPTPLYDFLTNKTSQIEPLEPSSKLTVNFLVPNVTKVSTKEVDKVILPAITGEKGVLPGDEPSTTELKPGVLSVYVGDTVDKYFVCSGYARLHRNSYTDIISLGAAPLDQIDPSLVQKGLEESTEKLNSASTELEKAKAQIGVDVHTALKEAIAETQ